MQPFSALANPPRGRAATPPPAYPAVSTTSRMKANTRTIVPSSPLVARFEPILVVLPALGGALAATWVGSYGAAVPFAIQAVVVFGGVVGGAYGALPLVRWEPAED